MTLTERALLKLTEKFAETVRDEARYAESDRNCGTRWRRRAQSRESWANTVRMFAARAHLLGSRLHSDPRSVGPLCPTPGCRGRLERMDKQHADPSCNQLKCNGGWECYLCGKVWEYEDFDHEMPHASHTISLDYGRRAEPQDPEPFCEFTGPHPTGATR